MNLSECLPKLEKDVLEEIKEHSTTKSFSTHDHVVNQGQIIRFLPIVVSGNIKVYSDEDTIQFLLYYITSGETCIFSFAHIFNDQPLEFSAQAETDSELLLLPIHKVQEWFTKYPSFSNMLLQGYQKHYNDLLDTTKQIICYNLEDRLLSYLRTKAQINKSDILKISHQDIADDLGTSREVITRLMKKLTINNQVVQMGRAIKVEQ